MADIDLPLWSIPPNWSSPVLERLLWLTNVFQSRSAAVQTRSVRLSPRREFEYQINPMGAVRSYFDQWIHRISDEKCLLPLWHDKSRLTATVEDGDSRLDFDTRWTEFLPGSLALLYADPLTFEVVEIDTMDDDGLDLADPLANDWPAKTIVYPLRRAWLDPEVKAVAKTSRVGAATVGFMLDGANDFDTEEEVLPIYGEYPLMLLEPNRRDDLEVQYSRFIEELDGQIGLIRRFDEVGRSFQTQFYNWTARGRQEHWELRQTLYRLEGRKKAFWMPSFNEDMTLARDLASGSNRLSIRKIGYTMLGGAIAGRERAVIYDDAGTPHVVTINGTSVALGPGEERLNLTANAGFEAAAGRTAQFLSPMRLENDDIEIVHHTDTMGIAEVGVACKSFNDTRVVTGPFIDPMPEAEMDEEGCGGALPPEPGLSDKWRVVFTTVGEDEFNHYMLIPRMEFRTIYGGETVCTGGNAFASAYTPLNNGTATDAFDDTFGGNSGWYLDPATPGSYLGYEFPERMRIKEFYILPYTWAFSQPRHMEMQAWIDGEWVLQWEADFEPADFPITGQVFSKP